MGHPKLIPLLDLPGDVICLLGAVAQIYLGRRFRVPRVLTYIIAFLPLFLFLVTMENIIPPLRRLLPVVARGSWIPSMSCVWCTSCIGIAIALLLRDRIPPFQPSRRSFLSKSSAALCALPAVAMGVGIITRKDFQIREVDIAIPGLHPDLHGLRLLQLSDIHAGPYFQIADVERVVDASNNLRPDLAFVTGDLITTEFDPLDDCLRKLKALRTSSGIWGCLGNHEMYSNIQAYTTRQAKLNGIEFLRHHSAALQFGQARMNLVGVDYQPINTPYLEGVENLTEVGSMNLLLSHSPDVFPAAAEKGFDLILSGHTHGGQINAGILGHNLNIADFVTPYTKGLYTQPTSSIYVNSGLGTIGMPVRIGAPAEITLIRLCKS